MAGTGGISGTGGTCATAITSPKSNGPAFETVSVTRTVIVGVPPKLPGGPELLPGAVTELAVGAELTVSAKTLEAVRCGRDRQGVVRRPLGTPELNY